MRPIYWLWSLIVVLGASGCTYAVPFTQVTVDDMSSRHDAKIPGLFSAKIANQDCCKKEIRSTELMCQAPTYQLDADQAVAASIQTALPHVFEDIVIGANGRPNDVTVSVDQFNIQVQFDPIGVLPQVRAIADVGFTVEAKREGRTVMRGNAFSQQSYVGSVVVFCSEASSVISNAATMATKEALERLAELLANSPALREAPKKAMD